MKEAPQILHSGERSAYWLQMVQDCSRNLRLSGTEKKLFVYYCDQANGFRPSLAKITDKTGLRSNKISAVRASLCQKGLLVYDGDSIIIDWFRIRNFAMLQEAQSPNGAEKQQIPFTKKQALSGRYFPVKKKNPTLGWLARRYWDYDAINWGLGIREPSKREMTDSEKEWIARIERMTEEEYYKMLQFPFKNPSKEKTPP